MENKEKLLINGPSRTSAVDPEETRLELRDEPPYVFCTTGEAVVEDDDGSVEETEEGEWRGSLVVYERYEYSQRQKERAFRAIKGSDTAPPDDAKVWKDVVQGVRRRLHLPDSKDGDAEVWELDAEDGEGWEQRKDTWVRVMVKTTTGEKVPWDRLVALTRDDSLTAKFTQDRHKRSDVAGQPSTHIGVKGGGPWPRGGDFQEFVPQAQSKHKVKIPQPWRQERIRHQSRFWITYVLHRACRLVREGENHPDAPCVFCLVSHPLSRFDVAFSSLLRCPQVVAVGAPQLLCRSKLIPRRRTRAPSSQRLQSAAQKRAP